MRNTVGDCRTGTKDEGNTPGKPDLADSESETRGGGDLVATVVTFTPTTTCGAARNWVRGSLLSLFSFCFHFPPFTQPPQIFTLREFFYGSSRPRIAALDSS